MLGGLISEDIGINQRLELDFLIRELAINSPLDLTCLLHHLKGECQLYGVPCALDLTVVPARESPFFNLLVYQSCGGDTVLRTHPALYRPLVRR